MFVFLVCLLCGSAVWAKDKPRLLIRVDNIGMSHAISEVVKKMAVTGVPFSTSVMVPRPWFMEAVEILNSAPQKSVGLHLTLVSEFHQYK